jgi:Transglycosylase-like domain
VHRLRRMSVCLLALAVPLALPQGGETRSFAKRIDAIRTHREATWRWQRLMAAPLTPSGRSELRKTNPRYLDWLEELWQRRAERARRRAARPPHLDAWLCIHRYERHPGQGWATRTGNGYYGGLQMDIGFQRRYGGYLLRRKGTADRWTRLEQMWVAERAYRAGRGFYPWPNTARACGLL